MAKIIQLNKESRPGRDGLPLVADVLILGGGSAGTWAALTAARTGSNVVLSDKGYCGTSGATAPSGTGVWHVRPNVELRNAADETRCRPE